MSEDSETITQDSPEYHDADAAAKRMWYAFSQPGVEVSTTVLLLTMGLLLAKQAESYAIPGEENGWVDEVARIGRELITIHQSQRVPQ